MSWQPPRLDTAKADTIDRLAALYAARDPELARAFEAGVETDLMAMEAQSGAEAGADGMSRLQRNFVSLAQGCARLMVAEDGPRVAALSYDGWDTHVREGAGSGRLAQLLAGLDMAIEALKTGLGDSWHETAVVVVTEFGRTAHENGADGTDHGTGAAAFLAGGAVNGGRVIADWPGLTNRDLFEGRDLKPTTDLRAVLKGVLRDHLGVPSQALAQTVFPGSDGVMPMKDLIV